ncbi:MAG: cobyric acid synthase [Promethearchaeota archaeon]
MKGKALMIQGTTSHAGKSLLVAALCRIFNNKGFTVAPFKAQNMSLNSYVTKDGAEIAYSQAIQAIAARIEPQAIFNPILLKPKGNNASQIILMGKTFADYKVNDYYTDFIPRLISHVKEAAQILKKKYDLIIIEGAGSPAEINLYDKDIANMFVARLLNAPVILIGDIDRGGVFASIYGTIKLLPAEDQKRIKYFVINKFRGDLRILGPGIKQLEDLIGIKCNGVIPYIEDLRIPAEDSLSLEDYHETSGQIEVKVIRFPRISNFNDFEILSWEPSVHVSYISDPLELNDADVIILPDTKNTVKDLQWLKEKGFFSKLKELAQKGVLIIGICGGYQILGKKIIDKKIEGDKDDIHEGLNLLPISTEFMTHEKITKQVKAEIIGLPSYKGFIVNGYEIHMGKIIHESRVDYLLKIMPPIPHNHADRFAGAINDKKNVFGCLLHGFFNTDEFREKFLEYLFMRKQGRKKENHEPPVKYKKLIEINIDKLAKVVEKHLNIDDLMILINTLEDSTGK